MSQRFFPPKKCENPPKKILLGGKTVGAYLNFLGGFVFFFRGDFNMILLIIIFKGVWEKVKHFFPLKFEYITCKKKTHQILPKFYFLKISRKRCHLNFSQINALWQCDLKRGNSTSKWDFGMICLAFICL